MHVKTGETLTEPTSVGGVLLNKSDGKLRPIAYFSRKLSPTERKYSKFVRELLAAHLSVRNFRPVVEGTTFNLNANHKHVIS